MCLDYIWLHVYIKNNVEKYFYNEFYFDIIFNINMLLRVCKVNIKFYFEILWNIMGGYYD